MKYTIVQIINTFSYFNLITEIEICSIFENIKVLKDDEKYSEILNNISFEESGLSNELLTDIARSISNNELFITGRKYLCFTMEQNLRNEIYSSLKDNKIYNEFMNDFIKLSIEKEKKKQR